MLCPIAHSLKQFTPGNNMKSIIDALFNKLLHSHTLMSSGAAKAAMKIHYREQLATLQELEKDINAGKDPLAAISEYQKQSNGLLAHLYHD
jgi:microcystin-dependent protein